MQIGMVGLGRMGSNMVRRLQQAGHQCVVFDRNDQLTQALSATGATPANSLQDILDRLDTPRIVWLMLPAAVVDQTIMELAAGMNSGDCIIDGGNSYYKDDIVRATHLSDRSIHYIDVGVSGGVWGLERGYCLMIGGDRDNVARLEPIFASLAPGIDAAPRTTGRDGKPDSAEQGYLHCGPAGAGHFVKMVHNGIEYALMASYAEGINLLRHGNIGGHTQSTDAETAPLREPEAFRYDIQIAKVVELWRRGSVVGSWLLDLTAHALHADASLDSFSNAVADSGEGRWASIAAIESGTPTPVLTTALLSRFSSRGESEFADRLLSAMRGEFGGHNRKA